MPSTQKTLELRVQRSGLKGQALKSEVQRRLAQRKTQAPQRSVRQAPIAQKRQTQKSKQVVPVRSLASSSRVVNRSLDRAKTASRFLSSPEYNRFFAHNAHPKLPVPKPIMNPTDPAFKYNACHANFNRNWTVPVSSLAVFIPTPWAAEPYVLINLASASIGDVTEFSIFSDGAQLSTDNTAQGYWNLGDPRVAAGAGVGPSRALVDVTSPAGTQIGMDDAIAYQQFMGGEVNIEATVAYSETGRAVVIDAATSGGRYGKHKQRGNVTVGYKDPSVNEAVEVRDLSLSLLQVADTEYAFRWRTPDWMDLGTTALSADFNLIADSHGTTSYLQGATASAKINIHGNVSPTGQRWVPWTGFRNPMNVGNALIGGVPFGFTSTSALLYRAMMMDMPIYVFYNDSTTKLMTLAIKGYYAYNVSYPSNERDNVGAANSPAAALTRSIIDRAPTTEPHPATRGVASVSGTGPTAGAARVNKAGNSADGVPHVPMLPVSGANPGMADHVSQPNEEKAIVGGAAVGGLVGATATVNNAKGFVDSVRGLLQSIGKNFDGAARRTADTGPARIVEAEATEMADLVGGQVIEFL